LPAFAWRFLRAQTEDYPIKIGFAILSHNEPGQLLRLAQSLNAMFGEPAIVCHHNFGRCSFDETLFPTNVRFVHPHINTQWGHISLPLAALKAFSLLRKYDEPDWFVLLSGSDYPVRLADEIVADLSNTKYDAFLDHREILPGAITPGQTVQDSGFGRPCWIPQAYDRYCSYRFWLPWPSRKLLLSGAFPFRRKAVFYIRDPKLLRFLRNPPSRIYCGDFWFQANQKAVDRLLDDPFVRRLVRFYRARVSPDESLFHTALCNQPDLQICEDHKRYEVWRMGEPHPNWLEVSDVPRILASGAHFARKFRPDGVVQGVLDQMVLGLSSVGTH
jgi:hypothetical protein